MLEIKATLLELRESCTELHGLWRSWVDEIDVESSRSSGRFMYQVPLIRSIGRGCPQVFISEDHLIYLWSLNFSWSQIAEVLGVSRMTIYRRRMDLGIVDTQDTSQLTDAELQSLLQQLR